MAATKKRGRAMFAAVHQIETEDAVARTKRRASSAQRQASSQAALSQQAIYGKLLEVRILLQRSLQAPVEEDKTESVEKCTKLLTMLLDARGQLSQGDDDPTEYESVVKDGTPLEETLQEEYKKEETAWKEVLDRRHKDVRLHAGLAAKSQFRILDSSFWQQIESTVSHDALRQKNKKNDDNADNNKAFPFDDSKVYQNLLKEFVATHPSANGAHRAQDRLRSPGTRRTVNKVDRRASKGRKLRYTPIPKLANFTYPLSRPSALLEEDAWFQSLFGGAAVQKNKRS
jgi:hypothetical protein